MYAFECEIQYFAKDTSTDWMINQSTHLPIDWGPSLPPEPQLKSNVLE